MERNSPPWWRSMRFLIAFLACLGYCNLYTQRVNLSMALVCMVNHTAVLQQHQQKISEYTQDKASTEKELTNASGAVITELTLQKQVNGTNGDCETQSAEKDRNEDGELVWDKETQGIVLGAFYWGYAILQLPSQRIIQWIGSKKAILICMFLMSTMTTIGPVTAHVHPGLFIGTRVISGLCTAIIFPAIYAIWGKWAPTSERTLLISICSSGSYVANAIVFPTSGLLCRYGFAGGWPSVFYVYAMAGFLWSFVWYFLFHDSPEIHPLINSEEKKYIRENTEPIKNRKQDAIPWIKILSSISVWAVVVAQLGYNWSTFLFLSVLPQYMREVLKLDITSNGLYTMMPQLGLLITILLWGAFTNWAMKRKTLTIRAVRKLSTFVGDIVPATVFIVVSYLNCNDQVAVIVLMAVAIGLSGTNLQGFLCNPYDIGAPYAIAIISLSNTLSVISGIISPYFVSALTKDETREQWQIVFFVTSGICIFCMLFYLLFGDANEMKWVTDLRKNSLSSEERNASNLFVETDILKTSHAESDNDNVTT